MVKEHSFNTFLDIIKGYVIDSMGNVRFLLEFDIDKMAFYITGSGGITIMSDDPIEEYKYQDYTLIERLSKELIINGYNMTVDMANLDDYSNDYKDYTYTEVAFPNTDYEDRIYFKQLRPHESEKHLIMKYFKSFSLQCKASYGNGLSVKYSNNKTIEKKEIEKQIIFTTEFKKYILEILKVADKTNLDINSIESSTIRELTPLEIERKIKSDYRQLTETSCFDNFLNGAYHLDDYVYLYYYYGHSYIARQNIGYGFNWNYYSGDWENTNLKAYHYYEDRVRGDRQTTNGISNVGSRLLTSDSNVDLYILLADIIKDDVIVSNLNDMEIEIVLDKGSADYYYESRGFVVGFNTEGEKVLSLNFSEALDNGVTKIPREVLESISDFIKLFSTR